MSNYQGNTDYKHGAPRKIGVLICNLGTPDAPDASAVRRYLAEFLADPRVVELPRAIWLPILHGIILRIRPKRAAAAYAKIWTDAGSPLMAYSVRQTNAIRTTLDNDMPGRAEVVLGMRYGAPSIASALRRLRAANARKILVLPLYPQYAGATTASILDAVNAELTTWRWVPALRFIDDYHNNPNYIAALAESVNQFWAQHGKADKLIMSFHGTPKASLLAGDPYHCQCHTSARLLAAHLQILDNSWQLGFQSRFGWNEWLEPYTETVLKELAGQGVKTLDVVCPGFAADCLETLEEIAIRYAEKFKAAGGETLRYIPALNDDAVHVDALTRIIKRNMSGWDQASPTWDAARDSTERSEAAMRAQTLQEQNDKVSAS